jgi:hypothetical protein
LVSPYSANGILAGGERKGHQRRALQPNGGLALQVGAAQVGIVGNLGALGVDHQAVGAPQIGQPVLLAVDGGVLAYDVQEFGLKLIQLELGEIERLVDAELALRGHDAVLGGLRQVESCTPVARSLEIISSLFDRVTSTSMPVSFLNAAIRSAGT